MAHFLVAPNCMQSSQTKLRIDLSQDNYLIISCDPFIQKVIKFDKKGKKAIKSKKLNKYGEINI